MKSTSDSNAMSCFKRIFPFDEPHTVALTSSTSSLVLCMSSCHASSKRVRMHARSKENRGSYDQYTAANHDVSVSISIRSWRPESDSLVV